MLHIIIALIFTTIGVVCAFELTRLFAKAKAYNQGYADGRARRDCPAWSLGSTDRAKMYRQGYRCGKCLSVTEVLAKPTRTEVRWTQPSSYVGGRNAR